MNTPISPRMSTWDVPHVPPSADPPPPEVPAADPSAPVVSAAAEPVQPSQPSVGEPPSLQEGLSAPLPRMAPDPAETAQVRFLNAVMEDSGDLRVSTGNRLLASSLSPGSLSEYFTVPAGFRPFAFHDASYPWLLLFRSTIPLTAGDVVTLALVRSGTGTDLVRIDDRPCGIQGTGRACLRCVNLVYDSPGLDLILTDGRVVFTDMRFKESTNYRRAQSGRYDLYLAQSPSLPPLSLSDIETVEELPMVAADWTAEPLGSFFLDLRAGSQASLYLMGDWSVRPELRIKAVENF